MVLVETNLASNLLDLLFQIFGGFDNESRSFIDIWSVERWEWNSFFKSARIGQIFSFGSGLACLPRRIIFVLQLALIFREVGLQACQLALKLKFAV